MLVTCVVFERLGRQIHFIDGAGGGYTRAAHAMKRRLGERSTSASQPYKTVITFVESDSSMRFSTLLLLLLVLSELSGCTSESTPPVLDGPRRDYTAFTNLPPPPGGRPVSGRFIYFEGTRYVLSIEVGCQTWSADVPESLDPEHVRLLRLPSDINVQEWIRKHHADYLTEYMDILPQRHALMSGTAKLFDISTEVQPYRWSDTEPRRRKVSYRFRGKRLVFEGGARIPEVQTGEHSCFTTR